jgi:hypothetical protein
MDGLDKSELGLEAYPEFGRNSLSGSPCPTWSGRGLRSVLPLGAPRRGGHKLETGRTAIRSVSGDLRRRISADMRRAPPAAKLGDDRSAVLRGGHFCAGALVDAITGGATGGPTDGTGAKTAYPPNK